MKDHPFFIATMPSSRPADYHLGYFEGSVFLDFNDVEGGKICLRRISFDGYGCCDLVNGAVAMSEEESKVFKDIVQNDVKDQVALMNIIRRTIAANALDGWGNALMEYGLKESFRVS